MRLLARRARPATQDDAARALEALVAVSTRCAGRWCLERSISAVLHCRLRGVFPEWHTGFALEPFRAHAWVAVDGEPVGEPVGLANGFTAVISVRPDLTPQRFTGP
ncbi:lasso peptide biosynthesis B2 protein [Microbacterium sp.]|uniref:lasso peptide biosynthesis B2 protein n=1 Tax=Microbacterium sp. TaxID=51671 RepID=UPI003523E77F